MCQDHEAHSHTGFHLISTATRRQASWSFHSTDDETEPKKIRNPSMSPSDRAALTGFSWLQIPRS